jgi:membrane-associated phospholipid phosphatase
MLTVRAFLVLVLLPACLAGQAPPDSSRPTERLFTVRDAWLAAGFAGATFAMWPLDRSAALRLQRDPVQNRQLYSTTASFFRVLGAPVTLYAAVGMYGAGRLSRHRRLADAGLHITESMVLAGTVTQIGKGLSGRARPRHFADTLGSAPFDPDPRDFELGRGWTKGQFQSFPSGHATAAFAFASALVYEIHEWRPQYTWWAGPIFYGGATLVGLSRMYNNAHWASDVIVGAAVGTFSGLKIVKYNHRSPGNRIDRIFLGGGLRLEPGAGAVRLAIDIPTGPEGTTP